ncbi:hypothetical protein A4X06_0g3997 [Tilletia controversa]|uniref:Uncharacterized protein n=1 Tax=Tilletia controversa TaxID=13291 RepID=A0A8X7MTE9_9BASI|nr:hypothetical protein A4X06_0g3997 [Tilletia controversa]
MEGHTLYFKPIKGLLRSDFGNPVMRAGLQLYSRRQETINTYMDSRMAGSDVRTRPPMVDLGERGHAYIHEVVCHEAGLLFVTAWYRAEGCEAHQHPYHLSVGSDVLQIPTSSITQSGKELSYRNSATHVLYQNKQLPLLNRLRKVAQGRPVYNVPMFAFLDDMSGAVSKRWNKHNVCVVQNAALDLDTMKLDASLKLFTASNDATPQEICQALTQEFESFHRDGTVCWDVERQESVLVFAHLAAILSDNPMAAELASNIGMKGMYSCRCCVFGGNKEYKASEQGLVAATKPGQPRTMHTLREDLNKQLDLATTGLKGAWSSQAKSTGVKDKLTSAACKMLVDEFEARRHDEDGPEEDDIEEEINVLKQQVIEDQRHWNPLFKLFDLTGFDVTKHLPCEILHTVLLGTVKYLNRATMKLLSEGQKKELVAWLTEANTQGIGQLQAGYLVKHSGSLVEREMKQLCQVMPWALQQIKVDPNVVEVWRAQAILAAGLHSPTLQRSSMTQWKDHLKCALHRFYMAFATFNPRCITLKPKMHLLSHALEDLDRYGTLPVVSTERFEGFNAIVRHASMLSNRKTPSRDIARRISDEETMRDILCDAVYWDSTTKTLRRPGRMINRLLNSTKHSKKAMVKLYGISIHLKETLEPKAFAPVDAFVHIESGDCVEAEDCVILRERLKKNQGTELYTKAAKIKRVLTADDQCMLELVPLWPRLPEPDVDGSRDHDIAEQISFDTGSEEDVVVVHATQAVAKANVNHNCVEQGYRIVVKSIRHAGDPGNVCTNDCLFRSAYSSTAAYGLQVDIISSEEIGSTAFSIMEA